MADLRWRIVVLVLVAALVGESSGQGLDAKIRLGDSFSGSIDTVQDIDILQFAAIQGSAVTIKVQSKKSALKPNFDLIDFAGGAIVASTQSDSSSATLKKLVLPSTGIYELRVRGGTTTGAYKIKTKQKLPKPSATKLVFELADGATGVIPFGGQPGLRVSAAITPSKSSEVVVGSVTMAAPGSETDLEPFVKRNTKKGSAKLKPFTLEDVGPHELRFENVGGQGEIKVVLKLLNPKGKKLTFEEPLGPLGQPTVPKIDPLPISTKASSVTLSGLALFDSSTLRIESASGVVFADVDTGKAFSIDVALALNQQNTIVVTEIFEDASASPPSVRHVVQDTKGPDVFIDTPVAGESIKVDTIDVAGRVGDMLSGFMGLGVVVNGVVAEVDVGLGNNGTFLAQDIPLDDGANTITVTATDALGNSSIVSVTVVFVGEPTVGPRMSAVGGNGQHGLAARLLGSPIEVRILDVDDEPFVDKLVTWTVVAGSGGLKDTADDPGGDVRMLQSRTDDAGIARASWMLGDDAGCGSHRVRAAASDVSGDVLFCATALPVQASQINVGAGNLQTVATSAPAPAPVVAWVSDGCNSVSGVPVTFTVIEGGGFVDGFSQVTVLSDATGHASTEYHSDSVSGQAAIFASIPGVRDGALFVVRVVESAQNGTPSNLAGLVLDNAGCPLGGAAITLEVEGSTSGQTTSAADGSFFLEGVLDGPAVLHIDGSTVDSVNGGPPGVWTYPQLEFDEIIIPGALNTLATPVRLPRLDPDNNRIYSTMSDTVLEIEGVEGLTMTIAPGSMSIDGQPAPAGTIVSLNQVHHDDVPMPMPDGAAPPFAWTLQPAGAIFDPPIKICYPNLSGLAPGSSAWFLTFHHDTGQFEIEASGFVVEDGSCIVSADGDGLTTAGWGCTCPPYAVTGECESCCDAPAFVDGDLICEGQTCCVEGPLESFTFELAPLTVGPYENDFLGVKIPKISAAADVAFARKDICCPGVELGFVPGCVVKGQGGFDGSFDGSISVNLGGPVLKAIDKFICKKVEKLTGGSVSCTIAANIKADGVDVKGTLGGASESCTGQQGWAGGGSLAVKGLGGDLELGITVGGVTANVPVTLTDSINGVIKIQGNQAIVTIFNAGPTIAGEFKLGSLTVPFNKQFKQFSGSGQLPTIPLPAFPTCAP